MLSWVITCWNMPRKCIIRWTSRKEMNHFHEYYIFNCLLFHAINKQTTISDILTWQHSYPFQFTIPFLLYYPPHSYSLLILHNKQRNWLCRILFYKEGIKLSRRELRSLTQFAGTASGVLNATGLANTPLATCIWASSRSISAAFYPLDTLHENRYSTYRIRCGRT